MEVIVNSGEYTRELRCTWNEYDLVKITRCGDSRLEEEVGRRRLRRRL